MGTRLETVETHTTPIGATPADYEEVSGGAISAGQMRSK